MSNFGQVKSICGVFWVSMKPKVEKYDRSKGSLGPAGDNLNISLKQSQSHRRLQNFFQQMFKSQERLGLMQNHIKFASHEKLKEKHKHAPTLLISHFPWRRFKSS